VLGRNPRTFCIGTDQRIRGDAKSSARNNPSVRARYIVPFDRTARRKELFQTPTKGTIPTIVRAFKAAVTRIARERLRDGDIWQRNYFERVLRDGQEYANASRYILENPHKWEWDKQNLAQRALPRGAVVAKFE